MQTALALPSVPVGKIKSFGAIGEQYEVGQPVRPLGDGDWLIGITLVKSGEQVEYRLSHLLRDPDAI